MVHKPLCTSLKSDKTVQEVTFWYPLCALNYISMGTHMGALFYFLEALVDW